VISGELVRSSEFRSLDPAASLAACLSRDEVRASLARSCPPAIRERVSAHVARCVACMQWVRHLDDHILEYLAGQRPEAELARMDAHLEVCATCRGLMHHVVQGMAQSWDGDAQGDRGSGTTFAVGAVVHSRYRIQRFVGRGGMGEVYEAFDQLMDRRVALKTVLCTVADRPRAARRFKEEVRNAQRVAHAHVCRINELQEHHGGGLGPALPFFTMEFIDGERLGHRLGAGRLPLEEVRVIALQLLAGLEAAHERGVLHLDFKSDNVMLRQGSGAPDAVIMDFGLSRVLGSESRLRTSERRQLAGTLSYMSVEQLECRGDLGPATDVYAFGVVLYEMLTGKLPFDGQTLGAALLEQLRGRPKPPGHFRPGLAPALDRFVLKCLSSDPLQRYGDAGQALAALRTIEAWSRPHGLARAWKIALPIALGGLLTLLFQRGPQRTPPSATSAALQPTRAPNVDAQPAPVTPPPASVDEAPPIAPAPTAPTASVDEASAITPAQPAASAAPSKPSRAQPTRPRPTPAHASTEANSPATAPRTAPATSSPSSSPAPSSPAPSSPAPSSSAPSTDSFPGWRPAHVPKRLSAPGP
jgi:serine/threonine protein kinase